MKLNKHSVLHAAAFFIALASAHAQVQPVTKDYFPTVRDFPELGVAKSSLTIAADQSLDKVDKGEFFKDAGFENYAERTYSTAEGATLKIELVTLIDDRAAYSLLSFLRTSSISAGPAGDAYAYRDKQVLFAQGKRLVRISSGEGLEDLARRLAVSVSHRIGPRNSGVPPLITHFPKEGYNAASLRYFVGPKSLASFSLPVMGKRLNPGPDMEIAQAEYLQGNERGTLSLLSFPTAELAEEYYDAAAGLSADSQQGNRTYLKKAGPLVAILEGSFQPATAENMLKPVDFSYSTQWIFAKNTQERVVWGVPLGILSTVVKSVFFVVFLALASVFVGVGFGFFRKYLRDRALRRDPENTDMEPIRLKMK